MSCAAIIAGLGFECRELDGNIFEVDTSFSMADGTTIGLYVAHSKDGVIISDNGDIIAHLISRGIPLPSRRSLSAISSLANAHGVSLTPRGELRVEATADCLGTAITQFISTAIEISRYERERVGISDHVVLFSEEVELYLRGWKPSIEVAKLPKIKGATGVEHEFDFFFDNKIIDCIAAKARSTGSLLRKASDIAATEKHPSILAILDDREDSARAATENRILSGSGLVSVLLMTRLIENSSRENRSH